MNFLTLFFIGFLIVFLIIYYIVPASCRYIVIAIGSYFFYGFGHPMMLITLVGLTIVSYVGGRLLDKQIKHKKLIYVLFFFIEILVLVVIKYTGFIVDSVNRISSRLYGNSLVNFNFEIVLPIGLSFIVFQTCSYLSEVYREKISAEKNFIRYASFAAFFPTILSGPIQKARNLLPQIKNPKQFDFEQARKGIILFSWGAFEKILVANNLSKIVVRTLDNYVNCSSEELLIGACCFSLYIYADFTAYSDMARGLAKIMNIDVGRNFVNPYLSKTTSEFWNRWHVSLNEWFIENIYIPLGGNRKGKLRKYLNILIVFFISGIWHGASWHFVVWGVVNGLFVVVGQIVTPLKQKIYSRIGVSESLESIVFLKRFVVFGLITMTWMFFHSGVLDALRICKRIAAFDFVSFFNPELLNIAGSSVMTFLTLVFVVFFIVIQLKRVDEYENYKRYCRQPMFFQCLIIAALICAVVFGMLDTTANVDTQFLYFEF